MNRLRRDEGAILAIVLVFLSLFGTFAAALAGLAVTSLREGNSVDRQGNFVYASEGAIGVAIRRSQASFVSNATSIANGESWSCVNGAVSINPTGTASATCTVTGTTSAGDTDPKPVDAITTLGGNLTVQKRGVLQIGGNVAAAGSIVVDKKATLNVEGTARATSGACPRVVASGGVTCPSSSGPTDPGYSPDAATAPTTVASVPTSCASSLVTFTPPAGGLLFNDASALSKLTDRSYASCRGAVIWFKPGVYYFNFTVGNKQEWKISDPNVSVVAGAAKGGWDTNLALRPSFPGGCDTNRTTGTPGAQFIFGGASRVKIDKGQLQVCRIRNGAQSVAMLGPRADSSGYTHQSGTMVKLGSRGNLAVEGTIYAPLGAIDLDTTRLVSSVASRGIIARSVKLRASPFIGKSVLVPPAPADADVTATTRIVGTVAGRNWIDAVITFSRTRTGGVFRYSASVSRWEILR